MKRLLFMLLPGLLMASCGGHLADPEPPFSGARPVTAHSSKWIAKVLEYCPAPGQFVGDPSCGTWQAAQGLVGGKNTTLSLGGFGGWVVFMFDHTVLNLEGADFVIHGNAFANSSEPGIVMVAFDANGNGLPDDTWYQLRGDDHDSSVAGYSVTFERPGSLGDAAAVGWNDSLGASGQLPVVAQHKQSYWPEWASDKESITFIGLRLTGLVTGGGAFWTNSPAGTGYADNFSDDYNVVIAGDNDTRGSNKFDISSALGADGTLPGIDFIKVATAVNETLGWLGEASTDVCGAISLSAAGK